MKIINVVGTRPNFIKISPLIEEMSKHPEIEQKLVHTGQHHDYLMSKIFFDELNIPRPDYYLEAEFKDSVKQISKIIERFKEVLLKEKPDLVVVVGDVNSTLACAITAKKLNIKVAHVEAGLRSFNGIQEEINRMVVDRISDFLFIPEESAFQNLIKEGISEDKMFFAGNIMIDTLKENLNRSSNILKKLKLKRNDYAVLTLHRPENVDNKTKLTGLIRTLNFASQLIQIVFPLHPRTKKMIVKFKLEKELRDINVICPLGYIEFIHLIKNSKFVLTDSGGIQEETTFLKIPCLTLRDETERPITITEGTNVIVGFEENMILKEVNKINGGEIKASKIPKFWDGNTAKRIVKVILTKQG